MACFIDRPCRRIPERIRPDAIGQLHDPGDPLVTAFGDDVGGAEIAGKAAGGWHGGSSR